jgi:hypothetical protein
MIAKKRSNSEINDFLSSYSQKISARLQRIEAVKLSSETIEETKKQIAIIKGKIAENKKMIKTQKEIFKKIKDSIKSGPRSLVKNSLFEPKQIDGIEIFSPDEDDIIDQENSNEEEYFND